MSSFWVFLSDKGCRIEILVFVVTERQLLARCSGRHSSTPSCVSPVWSVTHHFTGHRSMLFYTKQTREPTSSSKEPQNRLNCHTEKANGTHQSPADGQCIGGKRSKFQVLDLRGKSVMRSITHAFSGRTLRTRVTVTSPTAKRLPPAGHSAVDARKDFAT